MQNRLTTAQAGSNREQLSYDSKNRVVQRRVNGASTWFGWNLIEERDGAGNVLAGPVNFNASAGVAIDGHGGPFGNTNAGLGAGLEGSIDGFSGPGTQGQTVTGGGFSVGAGFGGGWSVGVSNTKIY